MNDFGLNPFTVHEASVAIWHAWHDGTPLGGPSTRHLQSAVAAAFRAGLTIRQAPGSPGSDRFGDWRGALPNGREWTLEIGYPLGAVLDLDAPVSCFLPVGAPLVIVVRFLDPETKDWRLFQFHYARSTETDSSPDNQWMQTSLRFEAEHLEEFRGKGSSMPGMAPRLFGVIEWLHAGRSIPCYHYDAASDDWHETPENVFPYGDEGGQARYVSLSETEDSFDLSYMAARTALSPDPMAGIPASEIVWINAAAFSVTESSGLTLAHGWTLEEGAAEPIKLPPSGLHWEHPQVRFRFLGRIYGTASAGVFSIPALDPNPPIAPPIDLPLRLGRLLMLPHASHILPAA